MTLQKSLREEIFKTVVELKNLNPSQKAIKLYQKANKDKPNLKQLRIIVARAWVHISEKLRKKLNKIVWQEIFVNYKERTLYRIYHPLTKKLAKI